MHSFQQNVAPPVIGAIRQAALFHPSPDRFDAGFLHIFLKQKLQSSCMSSAGTIFSQGHAKALGLAMSGCIFVQRQRPREHCENVQRHQRSPSLPRQRICFRPGPEEPLRRAPTLCVREGALCARNASRVRRHEASVSSY